MTNTEIKLADARTQLTLAEEKAKEYNVVRSCINAFISDARSVTFTMQEESHNAKKFTTWYALKQAEMKANPMLMFFHEQRRISIHQRSLQPNQRTLNIEKVEVAGKVVGTGGTATVYEFEGYREFVPGDSGNVYRLCRAYYQYLNQLVQEWLQLMK